MKPQKFELMAERVRNWGRWGADDQRGTLNHIDGKSLMRATQSVVSGKLFHLGLDFGKNGPQTGDPRANPQLYVTELFGIINPDVPDVVYSDDIIHMPLQASTQWDALGHVHYGGELYNGFSSHEHLGTDGARRCGVDHLAKPGIMSRGVLLDIARHQGVDRIAAGKAITPDDLNAVCEAQGVTFEPGDILLIRTGHVQHFTLFEDRATFSSILFQPGLNYECAEWIADRNIAAVCADNTTVEVVTEELMGSSMPMPFHNLCLRDMGCPLGEMFYLEELAADCASDGKYEFLLAAPPLPVTQGFGSPVNPLALK